MPKVCRKQLVAYYIRSPGDTVAMAMCLCTNPQKRYYIWYITFAERKRAPSETAS